MFKMMPWCHRVIKTWPTSTRADPVLRHVFVMMVLASMHGTLAWNNIQEEFHNGRQIWLDD